MSESYKDYRDPVYPISGGGAIHIGLTKREYFAAMAMQGFVANSFNDGVTQPLSTANRFEIAQLAVNQADALLKALDLQESEGE